MASTKPRCDVSDEEEARIQAGIAQDPDNPELTDEQIRNLRPASEVLPPDLYAALVRRQRDRAAAQGASEEQVTLALDRAALDHSGRPAQAGRAESTKR